MNKSEFKITSQFDNLPLSVLLMLPDNPPKAMIQIVHGMAEHKLRYIPFMEYLCSQGYGCIAHDQRGHGQSIHLSNDLGYMYLGGCKALIEDTHLISQYVKTHFPDIKLFLLGHSMGSMVVRSYAKRYDSDIDALIVSGSPSYNTATSIGYAIASCLEIIKSDHYRSNLLQKMAFGTYNKGIKDVKSANDWLSTDREIVEQYDNSPLCGFTFTTNGFKNLFRLINDCYSTKHWRVSNKMLPILFLSGEKDPCMTNLARFKSARKSMERVGYCNVSFKIYPSMRHEILNEIGKEQVYKDISDMLDSWNS